MSGANYIVLMRRKNLKLFLNKDGYGFNDIVTWLVTDRDYVPTKLTGYIYGKSLFTGRIGTKDSRLMSGSLVSTSNTSVSWNLVAPCHIRSSANYVSG